VRNLFLGGLLLVVSASSVSAQSAPVVSLMVPAPATDGVFYSQGSAIVNGACPERFWIDAEYLLWWLKKSPLSAPLVTTDPTNGVSLTGGGLADPTTQVLLGGGSLGSNTFSGGRFHAGYALSDDFAIEGGGFFFGTQSRTASLGSDATGNPFLFRPFLNVDTGNANAGSIISIPTGLAGAVDVSSRTQLWGFDVLGSVTLARTSDYKLTALAGFRYLDLREGLDIRESTTDLAGIGNFGGPPTFPGDQFTILDSFHTRNQFYGGEVGVRGETHFGKLVLSANANVSLGVTHQVISIGGLTTLTPAAGTGPTSLPGGILALPSNSGRFTHDAFSVVPQVGGQVGYDVTPHVRLGVGYDFLYWNNVVRPGSQVNTTISAAQLPTSPSFAPGTTAVPAVPHNSTDFWAHGVSFSLGLRF
jgi:Putative beta barrel porin-7 (BBP7)